MSTRYAVLITNNDGEQEVSDIKQMEGSAPDLGSNAKAVKVPDGVLIGMIKGGPVGSVGGYGFPKGSAGSANRSPVGVTKIDDAPAMGKAAKGAE
jgi:hypothetical protein